MEEVESSYKCPVFWTKTDLDNSTGHSDAYVPGVSMDRPGNLRPAYTCKLRGRKTPEVKAKIPLTRPMEDLPVPHSVDDSVPPQSRREGQRIETKKFSFKDLRPEDKQRVANLIKELAKTGEEKEKVINQLNKERQRYENQILQLVEQQEQILREREEIQKRFFDSQKLLNRYQQELLSEQEKQKPSICKPVTHFHWNTNQTEKRNFEAIHNHSPVSEEQQVFLPGSERNRQEGRKQDEDKFHNEPFPQMNKAHFPQTNGGGQFPQTNGGGQFPQTNGGGQFPQTNGGGQFPQTNGGGQFPRMNEAQHSPTSGSAFPQTNEVPFTQQTNGGHFPQQMNEVQFPQMSDSRPYTAQIDREIARHRQRTSDFITVQPLVAYKPDTPRYPKHPPKSRPFRDPIMSSTQKSSVIEEVSLTSIHTATSDLLSPKSRRAGKDHHATREANESEIRNVKNRVGFTEQTDGRFEMKHSPSDNKNRNSEQEFIRYYKKLTPEERRQKLLLQKAMLLEEQRRLRQILAEQEQQLCQKQEALKQRHLARTKGLERRLAVLYAAPKPAKSAAEGFVDAEDDVDEDVDVGDVVEDDVVDLNKATYVVEEDVDSDCDRKLAKRLDYSGLSENSQNAPENANARSRISASTSPIATTRNTVGTSPIRLSHHSLTSSPSFEHVDVGTSVSYKHISRTPPRHSPKQSNLPLHVDDQDEVIRHSPVEKGLSILDIVDSIQNGLDDDRIETYTHTDRQKSSRDHTCRNTSLRDQSFVKNQTRDQSFLNNPSRDHSLRDDSALEQSLREQSLRDGSIREKSLHEQEDDDEEILEESRILEEIFFLK